MTDAAAADDDEALDPVDLDALRRCIDLTLAAGGDFAAMVASMLQERPWRQVAEFASYSLQVDNLGLKPFQLPPSTGRDGDAVELADRLRGCGLSKFEPDPAAALAAKEKRTRR